MKKNVEKLWSEMERQKDLMLEKLLEWPEEKMDCGSGEKWNCLQVIEHVLISEYGTLNYMKKKTSSGWQNLPSTSNESIQNSEKLNKALKSQGKWQAPSVLPDPSGSMSRDEIVHRWKLLRKDFNQFLRELDDPFHNRMIFRHPYSGMMNLQNTLEFLANHIQHHIYQLQRLENEKPES